MHRSSVGIVQWAYTDFWELKVSPDRDRLGDFSQEYKLLCGKLLASAALLNIKPSCVPDPL